MAVSYEIIHSRSKKKSFIQEFDKVWVHGLLHLIGYDHIKNQDYYKMHKLEKKILTKIEEIAKSKKVPKIILEAQSDKLNFYFKHGYKVHGDKYLMDGIYHNKMFKEF